MAKFKNYYSLVKALNKEKLLDKLSSYAEKQGVKKNSRDLKISSSLLQTQLEAYIVRNFFDNNGFYPVFNSNDNTVKKALEICERK